MINLKAKIPGAPSFRYREFIKSDTALRKGIDNTPTNAQWGSIERLAVNVLQPVRDRFGSLRITSGFRSIELCEEIGSSKSSNHARGEASDVEPVDVHTKMIDIVEYIYRELDFRTLIMEYFPDGWIHVDYRIGGNVKRLKLKDSNHNYTDVTLEEALSIYG